MNTIKEKINKKIYIAFFSIILIAVIYILIPVNKVEVQNIFTIDMNNSKELIGNEENVFVAKILKNKGSNSSKKDKRVIFTEFEAEVVNNIKGKAPKKITITQDAGYKNFGKTLILPKDTSLLEEGKTYLLVTSSWDENIKYGLTTHKNTITEVLEKDFNKNNKVLEFKEAYINEIPHNGKYSKNAFKNLPKDRQEELKKEVLKKNNRINKKDLNLTKN